MAAGTVAVLISFTDGGVTKTALVNISVKKIQLEIPEVTGNNVYNKNELEVTIDGLTDKMEISGSTFCIKAEDYIYLPSKSKIRIITNGSMARHLLRSSGKSKKPRLT